MGLPGSVERGTWGGVIGKRVQAFSYNKSEYLMYMCL